MPQRRTENDRTEREPTNVQPEPRTKNENVQHHYNRANCSDVGSAQQYQGSLRYGIAARDSRTWSRRAGAAAAAWAWAVSHRRANDLRPRRVEPHADERRQLRLERVDRRIGMRPRMRQRDRIERAGARPHLGELQHARALRHEQANRELNGRHALDQIETIDRVQQFQVRRQASSTA